MDEMENDCMGVNKNDYLNQLLIYNTKNYQNDFNYSVRATLTDGLVIDFEDAQPNGDVITSKPYAPICMTRIVNILLTKKA